MRNPPNSVDMYKKKGRDWLFQFRLNAVLGRLNGRWEKSKSKIRIPDHPRVNKRVLVMVATVFNALAAIKGATLW